MASVGRCMQQQVTPEEAKQGQRGKHALIILLVSLVLAALGLLAWFGATMAAREGTENSAVQQTE